MIQTHTVNTFLDRQYFSTDWFPWLNYANGLVAPSFLFIAGLVQGLASRRGFANPRPLLPRLQRLGIILLVGYALQFPWGELLHWTPDLASRVFRSLCRVDILHCLAVSLALLLVVAQRTRNGRAYDWSCAVLTLSVVLAAPFIWAWKTETPGLYPLTAWLNPRPGSLFPLFPWLGFVSAGAFCSRWADNRRVLFALAAGGWLTAGIWKAVAAGWLVTLDYAARPDFFFQRLGWVLLVAALCLCLPRPEKRRILTFAGRESLLLYVLHLQLIHGGMGLLPSVQALIAKTQSPGVVAGYFLILATASLLLTWFVAWALSHLLRARKSGPECKA